MSFRPNKSAIAPLAPGYERWWWRLLPTGTLLLGVGITIGALILANGAADPPPADDSDFIIGDLEWASGTGPHQLDPDGVFIATSPYLLLDDEAFTIEIEAQLGKNSDPMAIWGIWLENADGSWTILAINGAQYVTARRCPARFQEQLADCEPFIEPTQQIKTYWKLFHLINPAGQKNQLRVDYRSPRWPDGLTLWLNREWMWDIPFSPAEPLQWGLWASGGTQENAVLALQQVRYTPASANP